LSAVSTGRITSPCQDCAAASAAAQRWRYDFGAAEPGAAFCAGSARPESRTPDDRDRFLSPLVLQKSHGLRVIFCERPDSASGRSANDSLGLF
jgi:hypothetical protein